MGLGDNRDVSSKKPGHVVGLVIHLYLPETKATSRVQFALLYREHGGNVYCEN